MIHSGTHTLLSLQVVLEVCDRTATVCVVLWNSVCLDWYRTLRPGHTLALNYYRVKINYTHQSDIGTPLSTSVCLCRGQCFNRCLSVYLSVSLEVSVLTTVCLSTCLSL